MPPEAILNTKMRDGAMSKSYMARVLLYTTSDASQVWNVGSGMCICLLLM